MKNKDKLNAKIKKLNLAWRLMRRALRIIRHEFETNKNTDVDYFIWKLEKSNDKLQSFIYKKIESEHVEDEFQKMIRRLKKPGDNNDK